MGAPCFNASPTDVAERWSLDDVADAHTFLDIQDDLEILKGNAINDK